MTATYVDHVARARTLWEEGTEPGRRVVELGLGVTAAAAVVDLAVNGGLTLLFDVVFVCVCIAVALLVRPEDFFVVALLPPLLLLAVCLLLGIFAADAIADQGDGPRQAAITGMAEHADALAIGYGLCLTFLAIRREWLQGSKRSGSPAPRRTTSGTPSE